MFHFLLLFVCFELIHCAPQRNVRLPEVNPSALPQKPSTPQQLQPQLNGQPRNSPQELFQLQPQAPNVRPQDQSAFPSEGPNENNRQHHNQPQQPPPPLPPIGPPQISWGQCPQLEPTMEEKIKKAAVITKCLELTPVPTNITRESVELHREQVAACALQMEGWFNEKGTYRFDKAESEIKNKKLQKDIENRVLTYHKQCKEEAEEKFPISSQNLIAQIQLYQACMDYFISEVCGIEVGPSAPAEF
ncbi:hypothetical protein B4U79_15176 [Dinothrombium tinctorium]|uniref:Uncharacterized protein n=1 Tax=Dinothrombium tinctorium TaxID=1965070 RepID=A0A3S3PZR3_9ACAR|nr:hypothetical protein B4U79_15176 [Dinothrombium tinctorium]